MTEISLQKLSELFSGTLKGKGKNLVSEVITDSRSIVSSKHSIFFALKGARNDGHEYIADLYERGIRNFVVSEYKDEYNILLKANFIVVDDTLKALQALGNHNRNNFSGNLTAIIGSNGKTIVKEWLYQLLHEDFKVVRSPKSFNSQLGVALSLNLLNDQQEMAFIEAGISQQGEMIKLQKIVTPKTVIFTSLGAAHQENFRDLDHKAQEKLHMAKDAEVIVFPRDNKTLRKRIQNDPDLSEKTLFCWSVKGKDADIKVKSILKSGSETEIRLKYSEENIKLTIPFIDDASVKNALSCLSFLLVHGLYNGTVLQRFRTLEPVEMRTEQKEGINDCILINDSYNSDLISLKIALDLLKNMPQDKQKTLILSDIMQTGLHDSDLYEEVSSMISDELIDRFIGIGKSITSQKEFFTHIPFHEFYETTEEFIQDDIRKKFHEEIILLKGSRSFQFENISDILEYKKHRTVLEINLEALTQNLNSYRSLIPNKCKVMVMVKAFSYGSGSHEIAQLLQHYGVDYLGVAYTDEGIQLREAGISSNIIVMNPGVENINDIINYKLEPEIYNFRILQAFLDLLDDHSGVQLPIHIKLETGMNRLGFFEEDISRLAQILKEEKNVKLSSVFSHLAAADEAQHDDFSREQIERFKHMSTALQKETGTEFIRHIANTSGIERFPQAAFDMVRVGIGLYGFSMHDADKLMNVSTLKTRITQIKHVKEGESVSYGRRWVADQDSTIAVIPVGYADGLNRHLSNEVGEVIVKGEKVPIVGSICMDMCMINITGLDAEEDDEVIIFGDEQPASELAKKLNTIPYEIITGISERVKRVYKG